jgi:hypothetical protein
MSIDFCNAWMEPSETLKQTIFDIKFLGIILIGIYYEGQEFYATRTLIIGFLNFGLQINF